MQFFGGHPRRDLAGHLQSCQNGVIRHPRGGPSCSDDVTTAHSDFLVKMDFSNENCHFSDTLVTKKNDISDNSRGLGLNPTKTCTMSRTRATPPVSRKDVQHHMDSHRPEQMSNSMKSGEPFGPSGRGLQAGKEGSDVAGTVDIYRKGPTLSLYWSHGGQKTLGYLHRSHKRGKPLGKYPLWQRFKNQKRPRERDKRKRGN